MSTVGRVLGVIGYVLVVIMLVVWSLWTVLVVWARTETTYIEPDEPETWQRQLTEGGATIGRVSIIAGCVLLVAVMLTVIARRRSRSGWRSLGIVVGSFSVLILLNAGLSWASFVSEVNAALQSFDDHGTSSPPRFEPPTRHEAHVEIQRMVGASLDAVTDPWDADGHRLVADDVGVTFSPCRDERHLGGVTAFADLTLRSSDRNAAAEILAVWDEAGYDGHDDVRSSDLLPIKRMALRDTTKTDGLVHLHIESHCSEAE